MVKLYVRAIKNGTKLYSDIPDLWKEKVKAAFDEELSNGEITQEQYDSWIK